MQNYVSINGYQTRPNPALEAVHGQAALFLRYDVPTYYVSPELLAAAARTELPDDMIFETIPFPFDALVFMLPKGTVCHPTDGECPFLALSRTTYYKSVPLISGATIKQAFQSPARSRSVSALMMSLADNQGRPNQPAGKYRDQLHRKRRSEFEDFALVPLP